MMRHYPDLGSTSDWSCCMGNLIQPIRSTTQIWVVTHSALVTQMSFRVETSGGIAKCWLFSQARRNPDAYIIFLISIYIVYALSDAQYYFIHMTLKLFYIDMYFISCTWLQSFFLANNMHAQVKNQRLGGQYTITIGKI